RAPGPGRSFRSRSRPGSGRSGPGRGLFRWGSRTSVNCRRWPNIPRMTPSFLLTLAFAGFLLAGLGTKFWLAGRQIRHVARHRAAVPPAFGATVSLAAHQKAADYTITKARIGMLELAFGAAVLLGWTLLGGLNMLNQALLAWLGPGL